MPVTRRVVRHQFSVPAPPPAAWSPLSLPNLVAWYKGDAGVTDAGGGAVSAWADQSGNGRHLTQATAGNRPTTGTRAINGINGVDFDGSDDYMTAAIGDLTQPVTVLFVVLFDTGDGQQIIYDGTDASKRCLTYLSAAAPANWTVYSGTNQDMGAATLGVATQGYTMHNGASTQLFVGGAQQGSTVNAGANNLSGLTVGWDQPHTANFPMNGIIAELVVQNALISAGDQTSWNTYCARFAL